LRHGTRWLKLDVILKEKYFKQKINDGFEQFMVASGHKNLDRPVVVKQANTTGMFKLGLNELELLPGIQSNVGRDAKFCVPTSWVYFMQGDLGCFGLALAPQV
jgi:hypothetical protein